MNKSKILGAVVILSLGVVLTGCEEEHHSHRPPPPRHETHRHPEHRHHEHRHSSRGDYHTNYHHWRGRYRAVAMNDLSTAKGTEINLEVLEVNGELYLLDPLDRMFRFHPEGDTAKVAGGYLKKENGQFIYKDVRGGIWLVEKDQ